MRKDNRGPSWLADATFQSNSARRGTSDVGDAIVLFPFSNIRILQSRLRGRLAPALDGEFRSHRRVYRHSVVCFYGGSGNRVVGRWVAGAPHNSSQAWAAVLCHRGMLHWCLGLCCSLPTAVGPVPVAKPGRCCYLAVVRVLRAVWVLDHFDTRSVVRLYGRNLSAANVRYSRNSRL